MCKVIGVDSVDDLIDQTIPKHLRFKSSKEIKIHTGPMSETVVLNNLKDILSTNACNMKNFIGQGYHGTIVPATIQRNILENPAWYTSYTPYQAEISQGRLEALFNYQTLVCELTGMDVSNASLLCEGSASAEALCMISRGAPKHKNVFFISDNVNEQTIDVIKTRAEWMDIEVIVGDWKNFNFSKRNVMGALVQYPDARGLLEDYSEISKALHANESGKLVVLTDPLALCISKPRSAFGADIVVGSMQRFGVPMWFGGPSAAFLATSLKNIRKMPGRLIGISKDAQGDDALRLALQTREQHIRLDKATSNVCTSQALLANMSAMYAVYHGPIGLQRIACRVHSLAQMLTMDCEKIGILCRNGADMFDTVLLDVRPVNSEWLVDHLSEKGMNIRRQGPVSISITFDETHTEEDVEDLVKGLKDGCELWSELNSPTADYCEEPLSGQIENAESVVNVVDGLVPEQFRRVDPYLQQDVFNCIQTETEMMRYLFKLQNRDLSLCTSMITLGSCTMKLNSVSSLLPSSWLEIANMHPFAPINQTRGYKAMCHQLERYLCEITSMYACTLQPSSGATGEYTGLMMAIRKYQQSVGEGHRNMCIIPKSIPINHSYKHGTNPASAAMMGMKVIWIDDSQGGLDLTRLESICCEHADRLSSIMITYPSTHGVFEHNIMEICKIVHQYGGNVYMDGANMNAQLGLTSPGLIGADVCHLNLHKTFSIPHGGGGPGMGPICVKQHLSPFLPKHSVISTGVQRKGGPVSSSPQGQAGIASIPWMFITMLGSSGLEECAKMAILNANYMMSRLKDYYKIFKTNEHGRCSHEFIIDVSDIRGSSGIVEEDIAKRLMDYGFHAPTMSWPIHHSLMIEPTESENKAELDRFVDALISIRMEIDKIVSGEWSGKDNPLKNAPHTERMCCADDWNHCYSRQVAAFPAPWVQERGKYWPCVARVDNGLGDKKLILKLSN